MRRRWQDAAQLGQCRRGIEPLRATTMRQRHRQAITPPVIEPMPVVDGSCCCSDEAFVMKDSG